MVNAGLPLLLMVFPCRQTGILFLFHKGERRFERPKYMKKLSFLFVLTALAMLAVVFTVSAQETGLPAINEAEAEPYLGTWQVEKICVQDDCIDIASMGIKSSMTFNTDNTAVLTEEGEQPITSQWYMENGAAYFVMTGENNTVTRGPISIDENGSLVIIMDTLSTYYTREAAVVPGTSELKSEAVLDDYLGEWFLQGILTDSGMLPGNLLGLTGTVTITNNGITYVLYDQTIGQDVPYELKDGKISVEFETQDENGNTVKNTSTLEYHNDNTLLISEDSGNTAENTGSLVFVRQEDYTPVSADAESMEEGGSLSSLLSMIGVQGEGLDLSSLLGNFDLNTLLQNEQVQGLLNSPQLSGLLSGLTDENGNFNLSGLMNGLSGLFGGSEGNIQGGTSLDGLLEGLGGLFGESY